VNHPRKFLFAHIPKSGGTTLGRILRRNFGASYYSYYGLYDHYMLQAADVQRMCDLHPQYRCISSHLLSLDLPFASANWDFRAFTFIREPVDRALSLYFYTLRLAEKNPGGPHPGPIEEFFRPILSGEKRDMRFFNAQTRFLTARQSETLDWSKIKTLMQEQRLLLAPLEAFDDACLLLERWFPEDFRDNAFPGKQNLAPRNQEVPEELRQALRERNAEDVDLYAKVTELFAEELQKAFGADLESSRQAFQQRCAAVPPDWLQEQEVAPLAEDERRLLAHLKKENAELKAEIERLGRVPFTNLAPPLQMRHLGAIWRRLVAK
jgi:hypothetical protein